MCDCPIVELYAKAAKERDEARREAERSAAMCKELYAKLQEREKMDLFRKEWTKEN